LVELFFQKRNLKKQETDLDMKIYKDRCPVKLEQYIKYI
jgi:hypothetical protein